MTRTIQRILILLLILLGLLFAGFFGVRSLQAVKVYEEQGPPPLYLAATQPIETDVELIRDWMTIGFLSHTYQLPRDLLYEALEISPRGNDKKSLEELNQEYFPDQPGYVLETVKATIQMYLSVPTKIPNSNP